MPTPTPAARRANWAAAYAARTGRPVADCLADFDKYEAEGAAAVAAARAARAARPAPTRVRVNGVRLTLRPGFADCTPALAGYALTGDVRPATLRRLLAGAEMNPLGGGESDFSGVSVEGLPFWVITGPGGENPGCPASVFVARRGAAPLACDWGA